MVSCPNGSTHGGLDSTKENCLPRKPWSRQKRSAGTSWSKLLPASEGQLGVLALLRFEDVGWVEALQESEVKTEGSDTTGHEVDIRAVDVTQEKSAPLAKG